MVRVAVLDIDCCRQKDCGLLCYKYCPMIRTKVEAIKFEKDGKPMIVEPLCTGCGICVKKCPFTAITIVNLPDELEKDCCHRFGANAFKLYRLPIPRPGTVLGLLGKNGTGKTTVLKVLAGEIKPNLCDYENPPDWPQIIKNYRGSILQEYFKNLSTGKLKVVSKLQYVDQTIHSASGTVGELLEDVDERGEMNSVVDRLQLSAVLDRDIKVLSGGELQRLAIASTVCREADAYLFDEPSSYLDVKQRIEAARVIRSLAYDGKMVVAAEHDLAILDYLSDQVCMLYGQPAVYGIVSNVHGVKVGINVYLNGYIPDENLRFRDIPIKFHVKPPTTTWTAKDVVLTWKEMEKSYEDFKLRVEPGDTHRGEVVGILGPNGIGKTTFIRLLAGIEKPGKGHQTGQGEIDVGYKPQYITTDYEGSVESLLRAIVKDEFTSGWYRSEIIEPLNLEKIIDRRVKELSGGELQRTAIAACLSKRATVYLLDEPSAYLDVEERLAMARTIRRIVENYGAAAFVVEHDVSALDFIADRIMVFSGEPGLKGYAETPLNLREGMNSFLKGMGITFRRDPSTGRPRVNKDNSRLDRHQKELGEYYYVSESGEG